MSETSIVFEAPDGTVKREVYRSGGLGQERVRIDSAPAE